MGDSVVLRAVGLASADAGSGVDIALVDVEGTGSDVKAKLLAHRSYPFHARMREAIARASSSDQCSVGDISSLNFALGELLAGVVASLIKDEGLRTEEVDLIGSSGQMLWRQPKQIEVGGMWSISALRVGEPAVIAQRTGITVISDFEAADMAAGGRGSPLTVYADFALFHSMTRRRAVQSIGDTSSLAYLPAGGRIAPVVAFDTGPGSTLVDAVVTSVTDGKLAYDAGGRIGSSGRIDHGLLAKLMSHPFLKQQPPKTVDRDEFGLRLAEAVLKEYQDVVPEDLVATVTAFVARSIVQSYEKWLPNMPDDVIISGRGARNPALVKMINDGLPDVRLLRTEDLGVNGDAKEAVAYALLASEAIRTHPANIPSATGAKHAAVLGKITPGRDYLGLLSKAFGSG